MKFYISLTHGSTGYWLQKSDEYFSSVFWSQLFVSDDKLNVVASIEINKILSKCKEVGDYTTENFLQWFVTEQREEENKFKEIIDNLKIIGNNTLGLYEMNKVLGEETVE